MLFLPYTIQVIPKVCINFQTPRLSMYREIFDTNIPMYYTGVRDRKSEKELR